MQPQGAMPNKIVGPRIWAALEPQKATCWAMGLSVPLGRIPRASSGKTAWRHERKANEFKPSRVYIFQTLRSYIRLRKERRLLNSSADAACTDSVASCWWLGGLPGIRQVFAGYTPGIRPKPQETANADPGNHTATDLPAHCVAPVRAVWGAP